MNFIIYLLGIIIDENAYSHRLYICERILTIRCPSCDRAILDFNGCFAIRCICETSFCGWCLKNCGKIFQND